MSGTVRAAHSRQIHHQLRLIVSGGSMGGLIGLLVVGRPVAVAVTVSFVLLLMAATLVHMKMVTKRWKLLI
jgi:alpha-beta hydrolase superfamily lysophospholipase